VSDPQVVERGMVVNLDAADGRRVQVMGDPLFMQESRRASHTYPPAAGENSAEILAELLAMPQDRIEALVQSGAVGAANRQEK
jgi:crotonobetainyl-CoA:carnitine CoA-transferase CaiB-like acyl-CoA transferase